MEEGREREGELVKTAKTDIQKKKTQLILPHQDIVWFDVSMENAASLHQLEREKKLLAVGPHGFDMKANVLAVTLENLPQVHAVKKITRNNTIRCRHPSTQSTHTHP